MNLIKPILALIFILIFHSVSFAGSGDIISFSATLADEKSGLLEGRKEVLVKVFSPDLPDPLWEETHSIVDFSRGRVELELGSVNPFSTKVFHRNDLVLSLTINEKEAFFPLKSVPYAIKSRIADTARSVNWDDISERPSLGGINGTLNATQVPPGFITNDMVKTISATKILGSLAASALEGDGSKLFDITARWTQKDAVVSASIQEEQVFDHHIATNAEISWAKIDLGQAKPSDLALASSDTLTLSGLITDTATNNGTLVSGYFSGDGSLLTNIGTYSLLSESVNSETIADQSIVNDDISPSASIAWSKINTSGGIGDDLGLGPDDTVTFNVLNLQSGLTVSGTVTANKIVGDGSGLTNVPYGMGGYWSSSGSAIYYSANSVGIGTSSPGSTLEVSGGVAANSLNISGEIVTRYLDISTIMTANSAVISNSLSANSVVISTLTASGTITANTFVGDGSQVNNVNAISIADNTITSAKLVDNSIINADISETAAIAWSKIDKTGAARGDIGLSSNAAPSFNGLVVANSVTANAFYGTGIGLTAIPGSGINTDEISSAHLTDKTIVNVDISDTAAISWSKVDFSSFTLPGLPLTDQLTGTTATFSSTVSANAFVGNGSGLSSVIAASLLNSIVSNSHLVSGTFANITGLGTLTIPITGNAATFSGTVTANAFVGDGSGLRDVSATPNDLSVTTGKIMASAVNTTHIADNAITSAKISNGSIIGEDVSDNVITTLKIKDATITNADLASNSVSGVNVADNSLADADLSAGTYTKITGLGTLTTQLNGTSASFNSTASANAIFSASSLSSPQWKTAKLIDYQAGSLPITSTGTFTYNGGTLKITVSGSGSGSAGSFVGLSAAIRDSSDTSDIVVLGEVKGYATEGSSHKRFIPRTFLVSSTVVSGTSYKIKLTAISGTNTDSNDIFDVTVEELPFK